MKKLHLFVILLVPFILHANKSLKIDSLINAYYAAELFNGTILVAENGKVIYKKALGMANMEWDVPNALNTKFRIASITKQFTSLLILKQVELGNINLEDPVSKYIPEYPKNKGDSITVHHLLVQTSGIPSYGGINDFFPKYGRLDWKPEDFIMLFWDLDLLHSPGTKHRYASFNHYLAGVILEKATGQSYEKLFKRYISTPCNFKDTKLDNHINLEKNRANGYLYTYHGYQNAPYRDMSTLFSAGAIITSVEDMYKYDRALSQDKLLSPEIKKIFFTPIKSEYACGWRVKRRKIKNDSVTLISHGGGVQGFGSSVTRIMEDNHLIVIFQNVTSEPVYSIGSINKQIIKILYDEPFIYPKESICKIFLKEMRHNGIESALKDYDTKRSQLSDSYNFNENQLLQIGFKLKNANMLNEAKIAMEHMLQDNKGSFKMYNLLGELYFLTEDYNKAIDTFNKTLQLDTENKYASEMIDSINQKLLIIPRD